MDNDNASPVVLETIPSGHGYAVGLATLNAPRSLNSLTLAMVDRLTVQLRQWQEDDRIACVVVRGSGDRAFCAGGDVVALRNSSLRGDDLAAQFFEHEYRLDYLIHTYRKPVIVWGHGVVMGGGLGLLAGASHRVVTPQTKLAMPEITIGLYPDVGGSWFLNRMPGRAGLFLALTGAAVNATDTLFLGLADRLLEHGQWPALMQSLTDMAWSDPDKHSGQISGLLRALEDQVERRPAPVVSEHYDAIQAMTDADSVDDIVARITSYDGDDQWLAAAAGNLASGCPTTIRIIDEQLKRSQGMSLKEVFKMEWIISVNCMRFGNFAEGVRALLVDKDKKPKFDPPTLTEVTPEIVAQYFHSPWPSQANPLDDL